MVLGKLPVPGCPTNLGRLVWAFFLSFLFSFSLSLGDDPILTEILL